MPNRLAKRPCWIGLKAKKELCYFVTLFSAWTLALFAWPRIICNKSHRRPQVRVHECPKTAKVFSPTVIVARKVPKFWGKIYHYLEISYPLNFEGPWLDPLKSLWLCPQLPNLSLHTPFTPSLISPSYLKGLSGVLSDNTFFQGTMMAYHF